MKPMLAAAADLDKIRYPVLASPKLDGVRAIIKDGVVLSRSLKPIPNLWVQHKFGAVSRDGLDGELIVGKPSGEGVFQRTSSGVMSVDGTPDVTFWVFDSFGQSAGFAGRLDWTHRRIKMIGDPALKPVAHKLIRDRRELDNYEAANLMAGYEGIMLRDPDGPYKHGRSTAKEGWLLKVKQFQDSEARILGVTELMHNANEATRNALGHLERSSHKAGKTGKGMLGSLIVEDVKTGVQFEIGTGFTENQRSDYWTWHLAGDPETGQDLVGQLVKYKFQPVGVKDKPRFPVFLGFRHEDDG